MTPAQFTKALDKLGLSQLAAARKLGYDGRTVRRYIAGNQKIPTSVERNILARLAIDGHIDTKTVLGD